MNRIYKWFDYIQRKRKIHKARRFLFRNCMERIKRGQTSCVGECAVEDWVAIQNILYEVFISSQVPLHSASSEHQSEDKPKE